MQYVHWLSSSRCHLGRLPATVRPWLLDEGSLTARLIKASAGQFRVLVLNQHSAIPLAHERKALGLPPRQRALVREVLLICNDQPWVFARSIFPRHTLSGELAYLRKLKNQSLGALLFKDPNLTRQPFEIAQAQARHFGVPSHIAQQSEQLWGRRSVFALHHKPILVQEIFLPAFRP